jgi:hypothetical protein
MRRGHGAGQAQQTVKRRRFVTWAVVKCGPASGMEDTVFCAELATQAAATFVPPGPGITSLLAGPRAGHAQLMEPSFPRRGADGGSTSESGKLLPVPSQWSSPLCNESRACCCPAQPVARVVMPPANGRPHRVDLLLCGHHYRVSHQALATAGATVQDFPGRAGAAEAALLGGAQQLRVNVS